MKQRKDRTHLYGHSNLDFRSKKDTENLKIYQPWKMRTEFGTMGYAGFKIAPDDTKKVIEVSEKLTNQQSVVSGVPDPKYFKTAQFYYDKKIPLKARTFYTNERVAQLDESFKGKEVFTGDSMMISDINKFRRMKTRGFVDGQKLIRIHKQEMIIKDKNSKNKEAIQETQLVNIEAEVTLENKVDINKVKEIRLALRRRYANRTNFRKIFKDWDSNGKGQVDVYDANSMINKLGIPINFNETRALIASSSKGQSEELSLEEFMHLIFSDNPALEINLQKIKFKEEKLYTEGEQTENLKKHMQSNIHEMSVNNEANLVKDYLRIRIPTLVKDLNNEAVEQGFCDFNVFAKVVKKFPLDSKYTSDIILKLIFNEYKSKDDEGIMDYRHFVNSIMTKNRENDFYNYKERYINNIKEKIERNKNVIQESVKILQENEENKKLFAKELEEEIKQHKHKNEEKYKQEVNMCIPSSEYVKKTFSNREEYFKKYQDLEKAFSPHPSLLKGNDQGSFLEFIFFFLYFFFKK
jgi:Ca2+-binding EF-hand superfamily protein